MELSHQFTVPIGVEETWAHFNDIASVAECFPGAQVTEADEQSFSGSVKVKLGPIALQYNGSGTFVEKDEAAHRFVVNAKGKDKRGNGTAGAHVVVQMTDVDGSTVMPTYPTGGNMDLTDAKVGSTVYLPVQVPGALLSVGDLHAVMARAESTFVAIEIAGTATLSVDLVKGRTIRGPQVDTGDEWVCVGLGDPVQDSIVMAYESLYSLMVEQHGWSREDAYVTLSALGHTELGGPTG